MPPTYYVIELTAKWLTFLLAALAAVVVAAFALGFGAGRAAAPQSGAGRVPVLATATATPDVEVVDPLPVDTVTVSEATPVPAEPTITPAAEWVRPTVPPTATPAPSPTPTATAVPEPVVEGSEALSADLWVQVLASSRREAVERARERLTELGFPRDRQRVVSSPVAGGNVLYKVRVGPFPSRESADRVVRRMAESGFPDAWVVSP
jgi:cell division protein FtsN